MDSGKPVEVETGTKSRGKILRAGAGTLAAAALCACLLGAASSGGAADTSGSPATGGVPAADGESARTGPPPPEGMTLPAYDDKGALIRPEGTEKWVFVGAGLGMNYTDEDPALKLFTNVFIQPEAYDHYERTGEFPEKTMLALEAHLPVSDESINKRGSFEGRQVGFEIALKDHERFEEGWAYFSFSGFGAGFKKTARAHDKADCYACHAAHAGDDNVFVQFYPRLKRIKEDRDKRAAK